MIRLRLQFSLASLLWLTLVAAVLVVSEVRVRRLHSRVRELEDQVGDVFSGIEAKVNGIEAKVNGIDQSRWFLVENYFDLQERVQELELAAEASRNPKLERN